MPVQIVVLLCAVLLGPGAVKPADAQGSVEEYQVKAAFLFHFAQLVEWPAGALDAGTTSVVVADISDKRRVPRHRRPPIATAMNRRVTIAS